MSSSQPRVSIVLLGIMGALLSTMSSSGYVYGEDLPSPTRSFITLPPTIKAAIQKVPSSASSASLPLSVLSSYALYSLAVDKYANHVLEKMKDVTIPDIKMGTTTEVTPSELWGTVCKKTNLVMNMSDRAKFNEWLMLPQKESSFQSSASTSTLDNVNQIAALCDASMKNENDYSFMYRSYVNFEELAAICKPFHSWRTLKFTFRRCGIMKFSKQPFHDCAGNIDGDGEAKSQGKAIAYVSIADFFKSRSILPIDVQWWGKIIENKEKNAVSKYKIVWTYTEVRKKFLWKKTIISNPKPCVELSSQPWDIVKCQDGMLGFRRDGHGYLAYGIKG